LNSALKYVAEASINSFDMFVKRVSGNSYIMLLYLYLGMCI